MVTITSAEFQKNFGRYKEAAQRGPCASPRTGASPSWCSRPRSTARLAALDARRAYHPAELPPELRQALKEARAPVEAARFDGEVEG